jgi:PAS domain S-box-containing protein
MNAGTRSGNWHRIYYLLALFDVLTVVGGLLLTHRLTGMFRSSVEVNKAWEARLLTYSTLGQLALAVDAPSNDIFDDENVTEEDVAAKEAVLAGALAAFDRVRRQAYDHARASLSGSTSSLILGDLDAVDRSNQSMVREARLIFEYFRRREPALAARRVATMDRRYADVNRAIAKLRHDAISSATAQLDRDQAAADALHVYEAIIAIAILLVVTAATAYGHKISQRVRLDADDREALIARLREGEALLERRVMERTEDLAETARRLETAQRVARLGSWEFDLTTRQVNWSDEMFRLFGFEPGGVTPSYELYLGLVHPTHREAVQASVTATIETGEPFSRDERITRRDGAERVFHASGELVRDPDGRALRLFGSSQDVTEQRAAEIAVRRSEERFRLAARATSDALWDWDIPGGVIWRSEGFRALFGYVDAPPTIEFWMSIVHPEDLGRIRAGLNDFLARGGDLWTSEYRLRRADGSYAWVFDRGLALRDEQGVAIRLIGSRMDITERKQAERMKSDFVSFVSHQLRTPLSGMSWMLELAADMPGIPEEARSHVADARESAARLATLINDLLDIARLESGRLSAVPEVLTLSTVTESVVAELQSLASEKGQELGMRCEAGVQPVFADAQLIRQAVTNLLSNAVKYTPRGGQIAVRLGQQGGTVTWSVRDTGVGVPKVALPRLFEKFYRAHNAISIDAEGTGLGLHLVRLIVEQAGGRVWCESEEGQGATFAFTLPAMAAGEEHHESTRADTARGRR